MTSPMLPAETTVSDNSFDDSSWRHDSHYALDFDGRCFGRNKVGETSRVCAKRWIAGTDVGI